MIGHTLDDPWAPHPVVNRHICYGDGGGGAPSVPDYSGYIAHMSKIGNELTDWGRKMLKWGEDQGIRIMDTADAVGTRAGGIADRAAGEYTDMMAKWKKTYEPLYDARAEDASRMIKELPQTEEQYAGQYAADAAQAFDASREAQERSLRSYGLKAPGSGAQRLDAMVSNQRRLGQVAAAETGRAVARKEARQVGADVVREGLAFPQAGQQGASTAFAGGNQQVGAPGSAISTTVGAMQPGLSGYNSALPWMKTWGDTMSNAYNQNLAQYNASDSGGSGIGGAVAGLAGTVAGSFLGPAGAAVGGQVGTRLGNAIFEEGGAVPNMVEPEMSGSQGAITDDVPARLNVGEFVIPTDVVEWRGEAYYQKDIMKARKEREEQTVAQPEMGPTSAIDTRPTFESQEAPL